MGIHILTKQFTYFFIYWTLYGMLHNETQNSDRSMVTFRIQQKSREPCFKMR